MAIALPPGVAPLPPNPPPALGDANPETRRRHLDEQSQAFIAIVKRYIDQVWREYAPWERWRLGTATAVNAAQRTVTVNLDPGPGGLEAVTVRASFGRPTWTAAQIVNKRVRVMLDTDPRGSRSVFIDDVVSS